MKGAHNVSAANEEGVLIILLSHLTLVNPVKSIGRGTFFRGGGVQRRLALWNVWSDGQDPRAKGTLTWTRRHSNMLGDQAGSMHAITASPCVREYAPNTCIKWFRAFNEKQSERRFMSWCSKSRRRHSGCNTTMMMGGHPTRYRPRRKIFTPDRTAMWWSEIAMNDV